MTVTDERYARTELATELYGHVPLQYQKALDTMLALVPAAKAHFEVGNVVTAIQLLNAASRVRVGKAYSVTKELMLDCIFQAMPTMYHTDLDPEFVPPLDPSV